VDGNEVGGHRQWGGLYSPAVAGSRLRWARGSQGVDVAGIGAVFDMADVGQAVGVEVAGERSRLTHTASSLSSLCHPHP
jgi:hypothetical protein